MKKKHVKYPYVISNTDWSNLLFTHWQSKLDIHPKNAIPLFDFFGIFCFKKFLTKDDSKIINKVLYGPEKFKLSDNRINIL